MSCSRCDFTVGFLLSVCSTCELIVHQHPKIKTGIKLSPNVNSLDTVKFVLKMCVILRTLTCGQDTFLSRSHVTVTVSSESSSLLSFRPSIAEPFVRASNV